MKLTRKRSLIFVFSVSLLISAHFAWQEFSRQQFAEEKDGKKPVEKIAEMEIIQSDGTDNKVREPLIAAETDPFKAVNFSAPVQATPAASPPVLAENPVPVAPTFPYGFAGRMIGVDGTTLTFLSRDSISIPIKVGSVLDQIYRVDEVTDKEISLTYLPLNEKISIPIRSAAE